MMSEAYNMEFLDMGQNPRNILAFQWNNLDFEVELDENGIVLPQTLECLCEIVEEIDFPPKHELWRTLRNYVAIHWGPLDKPQK